MHDHAKEQLIQMLRKSISEAAIEPTPFGGLVRHVENEKIDTAIAKHVGDNMGDGFSWIFVPNFQFSASTRPLRWQVEPTRRFLSVLKPESH